MEKNETNVGTPHISSPRNKHNRIGEIDYLRGFAILGVILIHASANFSKMGNVNLLLISLVFIARASRFAVPLFILISGIVLSLRYYGKFSYIAFYKRRAISIIPQYLIFSTFFLCFLYLQGNLLSPSDIVFKFLTASSYYHLWFFAIIMQFYMFYPFLIRLYSSYQKQNKTTHILILLLLIQVLWNIVMLLITTRMDNEVVDIMAQRIFVRDIFYFMLGVHIGKNLEDVKNKICFSKISRHILLSLLITMVLSFSWILGLNTYGYFYDIPPLHFTIDRILEPILYIATFLVLMKLSFDILKSKTFFTRILNELGTYSFGIYFIHAFYLVIIADNLELISIFYTNWIFYPMLIILDIILSYVTIKIIGYLPYSELIIGVKKREHNRK